MFKNFDFQGRLHQVDYAVEAMKQGSATVGLKSATHAVVVALKVAYKIPKVHPLFTRKNDEM